MPNPIVRFEIGCTDFEKTRSFYAGMFDWLIESLGNSARISTGDGIAGGLTMLGHEPYVYTMFYVQVDDVEAKLAQAEKLGGQARVGPVALPTGTFAWFTDPEGNLVGLWQPKK